jgi:probable HAF family extracellular repeat protein
MRLIRISFSPLKSVLLAGVAAGGMAVASAGADAQTSGYTYTPINDPLGAKGTFAYGINDAGQIVGGYIDSSSNWHGFLDTNGTFTTINVPFGGSSTVAYGINNAGQIVGGTGPFGFLDVGGNISPIGFGPAYSSPLGISNSGEIVGSWSAYSTSGGFLDANGNSTGVSDPFGSYSTTAYGVNDSGQIVGYFSGGIGIRGFVETNGTYTTISDPLGTGSNGTRAYGINDAGQVVGSFYGNPGYWDGFLYANGTFTTISDPLGGETYAYGINNDGQIVGYYTDASGNHGFLATPDGTSTDGAPLPVSGGTLPGAAVLLGWLARRLAMRRKARPDHWHPSAA